MDQSDIDLEELVALGKAQGYLTYDQVNEYLPDEAVNPDKLDSLLVALDDLGIALVNEPPELDVPDPSAKSRDTVARIEVIAALRRRGSAQGDAAVVSLDDTVALERRSGADVPDADGRDPAA